MQIPIGKPSQSPSTITTVLQKLKPSGTPCNFHNQQPNVVPTLPPDGIPSNKTSCITSSGPSYNPIVIPSVSVSVFPSPFPSITPTTLILYFQSDKPSYKTIIYPLQAPNGARMYNNYVEFLGEAVYFKKKCRKACIIPV